MGYEWVHVTQILENPGMQSKTDIGESDSQQEGFFEC